MSIDDLDLKLTLFHDDVGLCPNGQCSTSLRTDAVFDLGKKSILLNFLFSSWKTFFFFRNFAQCSNKYFKCEVTIVDTYVFTIISGTAYIGSNSTVMDLEGYYPGFIGCIQDVSFDYKLMIPEEMIGNQEVAQNVQVNTILKNNDAENSNGISFLNRRNNHKKCYDAILS